MSEDVIYTARNLRASRETQALGEDHPVIKAVADQFKLLQQSVEAARFLVRSKDGRDLMADLESALADAAHDASLATVAEAARDAFAEAHVVPIKRPSVPVLTVVK